MRQIPTINNTDKQNMDRQHPEKDQHSIKWAGKEPFGTERFDIKSFNKEKRGQLITAAAFIGIGIFLGHLGVRCINMPAGQAAPSSVPVLEETASDFSEEPEAADASQLADAAETERETDAEPAYEPSPDKLNLAYYYPEDCDSEDIINSYAGQVFQNLTVMDSEWLADIYELVDVTPSAMAQRLGKSTESVMGAYNPKDAAHDPDNPATWSVNNWKRIHVSFSDGDGRSISGFSNVKDILSMASVYTYYTDLLDVEAFEAYAEQLWEASHSYTLSMGDVYYCDGCIDRTDEEIALEEAMEEEAYAQSTGTYTNTDLGQSLSDSTGAAFDAADDADNGAAADSDHSSGALTDGSENTAAVDAGIDIAGLSSAEYASAGSDSPESLSAGLNSANSDPAGFIPPGLDSANSDSAGSVSASPSPASSESTSHSFSPSSANGEQEIVTVIRRNKRAEEETGSSVSGVTGSAISETTTSAGEETHPASAEIEGEAASSAQQTQETSVSPDLSSTAASGSDAQHASLPHHAAEIPGTAANANAVSAVPLDSSASPSSNDGNTADTHSACPGHIDLYIRVKLLGLDDRNGLFSKDIIGNVSADAAAEEEWQGWTDENIAHVRQISNQDWFADYGLSVSSISLSTPLSGQEISDYMNQLPADLSDTRKAIIRFALSSVGKVPYYWGGKASHPGYEGNYFGALVPSDDEGRILKGLDCSGWISWVYWSVTGKPLEGSSTSSLILCGEKISRSDLKPGDIIVRTGSNAHVVMFLSWSADGRMNVIHESSASVNNVTIKTMEAAWPYYRRLVE